MLREKVILDPNATDQPAEVTTEPSPSGGSQKALNVPSGYVSVGGGLAPTHYRGIPLSEIIARWWREVEKCPECDNFEPAPGNRNTPLQRLACELTFLLDDNKEWIRQTLPTYGLAEAEYEGILDRAIRYKHDNNRMYMSKDMRVLLKKMEAEQEAENQKKTTKTESDGGSFALTTPPPMPPGIQQFVDAAKTPAQKAVSAVTAMVGFGVLLSNLRAVVSGGTLEEIPILLAYCWGKTSAGKTTLTRSILNIIDGNPKEQTLETLRGMDRCFELLWQEVQKRAKGTGGGSKTMPVLPNLPIRCLANDFTPAAYLQTFMDADSMGALLYCHEHDLMTINGGMTAWHQIDSRLRTMFDAEWISARRVGINSVSGKAQAIGCSLICGTDANVSKYFGTDQVLNGLANRMIFMHLVKPQGKRVYPRALTKRERYIVQQLAQRALDQNIQVEETTDKDGNLMYEVHRQPEQQLRLGWLWDRLTEEFEDQEITRGELEGSEARVTVAVRAKETAFRAGMILYWLWGRKNSAEAKERLFEATMWVARTMSNGLLELFQNSMDESKSPLTLNIPQTSAWDRLDDVFSKEQLAQVLQVMGKRETPNNVLRKWKQLVVPTQEEPGVIERFGDLYYKKGTEAHRDAKAMMEAELEDLTPASPKERSASGDNV